MMIRKATSNSGNWRRRTFHRRSFCRLLFGGSLASVLPHSLRAAAGEGRKPWLDALRQGIQVLNELFWSPATSQWLEQKGDDLRGLLDGRVSQAWWPGANAAELLLDAMTVTGTSDWDKPLAALHALHRRPVEKWPLVEAELKKRGQWADGDEAKLKARAAERPENIDFCNEYLDDSGWWGIAWLKMAKRARDARCLETAKAVHAHMVKHWRPDLDGGVSWSTIPRRQRPNSITNSLFLVLSARLAQETRDHQYREWAEKTLAWMKDKRLFDGEGIVDGPGGMRNWWSYNQGVYMGGLLAFADLSGQSELIDESAQLADVILKAGSFVSADSIIVERRGTRGRDGCLFKGILARYLAQLHAALKLRKAHAATQERIQQVLAATANAILNLAADDGLYLAEWHPDARNLERNFNTHVSALMALAAAASVHESA